MYKQDNLNDYKKLCGMIDHESESIAVRLIRDNVTYGDAINELNDWYTDNPQVSDLVYSKIHEIMVKQKTS
ncbi:hypothetical protein ACQ5RK_00390 [Latilactobacillus curvatus]